MNSSETAEVLLHRFVLSRSEGAFREIVQQQSGMVLATARRQLRGDDAAAEDVAQEVFGQLVEKAGVLDGKVSVAGWLYRQTCRLSSNHLRAEGRRRVRETNAAEMMKTEGDRLDGEVIANLDEALNELPDKARDAVVMRFFEGRNHQGLAGHFGISEEAARKRVARAVELLKAALAKRGFKVSAPLLVAGLAGLGSEKVAAATISQLTVAALKIPAAKVGLVSVGPMLVGVLAVSVVAGGIRVAEGMRGESEVGESRRAISSRVVGTERLPEYLRPLSVGQDEEAFFAEILALIHGPQHRVSELKLRLLLDQIPNTKIESFIENSKGRLFRPGREDCYLYLVHRWSQDDPGAALDLALEVQLQKLTETSVGYGVMPNLLKDWCERDAVAACDWLDQNWTDPKLDDRSVIYGFGEKFGTHLGKGFRRDVMAREAVTALEKSQGPVAAMQFLERFDERMQVMMLTALAIAESEDLVGLAKLLHEKPKTGDFRRIKVLFWARWNPNTRSPLPIEERDEVLRQLPSEMRLEARLAMVMHGENLPSDDEFLEPEFLQAAAEAYLEAPFTSAANDFELSKWLHENGKGLDLDKQIRRRIERWSKAGPFVAKISNSNQILLALHLSDVQEGRAIARKYFEILLKWNAGSVPYFLKEATLPDDLRVEFEQLQQEAKR